MPIYKNISNNNVIIPNVGIVKPGETIEVLSEGLSSAFLELQEKPKEEPKKEKEVKGVE